MKIWEVLTEENVGKFVTWHNIDVNLTIEKKLEVGKSHSGSIGLFSSYGYAIEVMSTLIMKVEFEIV